MALAQGFSYDLLGSCAGRHTGDRPPRQRLRHPWRVEILEERALLSSYAVTSLADAGDGTLRWAITQANLDPARDTITFAPSVTGTIALLSALPDLSTSMVIAGPGIGQLTVSRAPPRGRQTSASSP